MKRFIEKLGYPLILLVTGLIVFGVVMTYGHISIDDPAYVFNNPYLRNPASGHILRFLFQPYANMIRPLDSLAYLLEYKLWGLSPAGYHLANLLMHITDAVLVFVLLGAFIEERFYRFLAALIFLLHPVQAETAAWISEQKSTLSTLFLLLAMTAYIRFRRKQWPAGAWITMLCFVAGLLVKPNIVIFPVLLVWYDFIFTDEPLVKNIREKYSYWILSLGTGMLYLFYVHKTGFTTAPSGGGLYTHVLTTISTIAGIAQYPLALVFPFYIHMVAYPDHPVTALLSVQFLSSVLFLIVIAVLAYTAYKKGNRIAVFFTGWYYINFMLASGIFPMAYQGAVRYLYTPVIGPIVLFVLGIRWLARNVAAADASAVPEQAGVLTDDPPPGFMHRKGRTTAQVALAGAVILILGSYIALDRVSLRAWKDDLAFWKYQVWSQPENGRDRVFFADALADADAFVPAVEQVQKAAALSPGDPVVWSEIVSVYYRIGMYDAARIALVHFKDVLLANYGPVDPAAVPNSGTGYDVRSYYFLLYSSFADLAFRTSEYEAAVHNGRKALALQPGNEHVFALTTDSLLREHKPDEVLRLAHAFIKLKPDAWTGYLMEGLAYGQMDNLGSALPAMDKAIALCRDNLRRAYMIQKRQEMYDRLKRH